MKNHSDERSGMELSPLIALVIILVVSAAAQLRLMQFPLGPDSQGIRTYSEDLLNGRNPYQRHDKALSDESVFPNYMPMLYATGAAILAVDGGGWDAGTRLLFVASSLAIAALIYAICARRQAPIMGLLGAAFWSFGRFTPMTVLQGHWDNLTLMLLLASLHVFESRPRLSCILLGLSISFKQSSLIVAPIYVILQMWRMRPASSAALIAVIPLLSIVPFIVWDQQSLAQGLSESVTRQHSASVVWPPGYLLSSSALPSTMRSTGIGQAL
jgi:hypothetical protein